MTKEEVIETLYVWINNADDEFDREEAGRVDGLKDALRLVKQIPDIDIEKFSLKKDDIMVVSFDRDEVYPEDLGKLASQLGTKYPNINFLFFPNNYDIKEYTPELVRKRMQDIIDWTYKIEKGENDETN